MISWFLPHSCEPNVQQGFAADMGEKFLAVTIVTSVD